MRNDVQTSQSVSPRSPARQDGDPARYSDATLTPPVDVIEDASGITLWADLPGVPKDKLEVRVEADQLSISGEVVVATPESLQSSYAEVSLPRYRRLFTLSRELDTTQVSADFTNGLLKVRIPKAAHAQPRKVEVKVL